MGSGGIPIRIRRTVTDTVEAPSLGEMFLQTTHNKTGVYNGTKMLWSPGIDPLTGDLVLNQGQALRGRDSSNALSGSIDFDTPGEITFRDETGVSMGNIGVGGASFNDVLSSPLPGGYYNKMTHPGFIPDDHATRGVDTATSADWIGCSTYVWKKSGAVGDIVVTYEPESGNGLPGADSFVMKVVVTNDVATNGLGVRCWMFEGNLTTALYGNHRMFVSCKGDVGETSIVRVGNAVVGYSTLTVTGTGNWERVSVDLPTISSADDFSASLIPIAIDVCYNPTGGSWFFAEPTCQADTVSAVEELYQSRSLAQRLLESSMYRHQPHSISMDGPNDNYINLSYPLYAVGTTSDQVTYDVYEISTEYPVTISTKNRFGYTLSAVAAPIGTRWRYRAAALYRGSLDELV